MWKREEKIASLVLVLEITTTYNKEENSYATG
jgi:hypothetical protein